MEKHKMKRTFLAILVAIFVLSTFSVVSAKTLVAGKIYNSDFSSTIADASVNVTCNNTLMQTTSKSDGTYSVAFNLSECNIGNVATVAAVKGDLHGEKTGTVFDGEVFDIPCDLAVVNVPLVPEFGLVIGGLTLLSAIAVFFVVRKK
jgi:hypothetical protein